MNRQAAKILVHLLCWFFFTSMVAAFLNNGNTSNKTYTDILFSGAFILFIIFYVFLFYLNQHVLMPRLFLTKRYGAFAAAIVLLLAATFYLKPFEHSMRWFRGNEAGQLRPPPKEAREDGMPPPPDGRPAAPGPRNNQQIDIISLIVFFMAMAVSAMLVLSKQWQQAERNKAIIEAQKAKAELAFLKAQISPHFLFNVLNNIYGLAITKNEQTASSILRLSNIMRYVTDDARTDFVPIEKEIACINDYIELQKIRLSKKVTVRYTVAGVYGDALIAPLILISFVENCFKHGISNNMETEITIHLNIDRDKVELSTSNPVSKRADDGERAGVGLQNVTQRLEHLYKNKYKLHLTQNESHFKVNLFIERNS